MAKITSVKDLFADPRNANKGTERGAGLLEKSLRAYGLGRSILIDRKGRVIAGNKTVEQAAAIGISKVQVVESDGTTIVAVQRTDLDLEEDLKAQELAIADNRVGELNLEWDANALLDIGQTIDLGKFFGASELKGIMGEHLEACDLENCPTCGRKIPKGRSKPSEVKS